MIEIVLFDSDLNIKYMYDILVDDRTDALNALVKRIWSDPELLKFMQTDCTGLQIKNFNKLYKRGE